MKKVLYFLIIVLLFSFNNVKAETISFNECVDGDTVDLKIDGKIKKVRFLAIDTPETKHPTKGEEPYGKEASNYTCSILKNANKITLEYEKNKNDKYGRVLAWVFTDDQLLQAKLVKKGLAKVAYLYDDYKYTEKLQKLESEAKQNKLKIWSDYKEDYSEYIYLALSAIIVLIVCIYDKSYRKKTTNKIKNKVKKEANKHINKLFK